MSLRSELTQVVSAFQEREAWWVQGVASLELREEAEQQRRSQLEKHAEAEWTTTVHQLEAGTEAARQTVLQHEVGLEQERAAVSHIESRATAMVDSSQTSEQHDCSTKCLPESGSV